MFLLVNEFRGNIDVISSVTDNSYNSVRNNNISSNSNQMGLGANMHTAPTSGTSGTTSVTKNKEAKHEFRVHISPNDLEGIELIW
jgi:hypothetical protein